MFQWFDAMAKARAMQLMQEKPEAAVCGMQMPKQK